MQICVKTHLALEVNPLTFRLYSLTGVIKVIVVGQRALRLEMQRVQCMLTTQATRGGLGW